MSDGIKGIKVDKYGTITDFIMEKSSDCASAGARMNGYQTATEALIAKMEAAHAAEVERLKAERDAAVAAKERAEEALLEISRLPYCDAHMSKALARAALAAAPDKPQYAALAQELSGGPEGDEDA